MLALKRFAGTSFAAVAVAVLASHCSSRGSNSAGAAVEFEAGSGLCSGSQTSSAPPTMHRAAPAQCTRTAPTYVGGVDASAPQACATDADCWTDAGVVGPLQCVQGQCGTDECIADSDCSSGKACVCSAYANASVWSVGNRCVAASCTLDSDCGAGGYCTGNQSYGVSSLRCTTAADTCRNPKTDCDCLQDGGFYFYADCPYTPEVGSFVCYAVTAAG